MLLWHWHLLLLLHLWHLRAHVKSSKNVSRSTCLRHLLLLLLSVVIGSSHKPKSILCLLLRHLRHSLLSSLVHKGEGIRCLLLLLLRGLTHVHASEEVGALLGLGWSRLVIHESKGVLLLLLLLRTRRSVAEKVHEACVLLLLDLGLSLNLLLLLNPRIVCLETPGCLGRHTKTLSLLWSSCLLRLLSLFRLSSLLCLFGLLSLPFDLLLLSPPGIV